jgi:hypothetical protein
MTTKEYRKAQLNNLLKNKSDYLPSIQIVSPDNEKTNYLNVTRDELRKIIRVLKRN